MMLAALNKFDEITFYIQRKKAITSPADADVEMTPQLWDESAGLVDG